MAAKLMVLGKTREIPFRDKTFGGRFSDFKPQRLRARAVGEPTGCLATRGETAQRPSGNPTGTGALGRSKPQGEPGKPSLEKVESRKMGPEESTRLPGTYGRLRHCTSWLRGTQDYRVHQSPEIQGDESAEGHNMREEGQLDLKGTWGPRSTMRPQRPTRLQRTSGEREATEGTTRQQAADREAHGDVDERHTHSRQSRASKDKARRQSQERDREQEAETSEQALRRTRARNQRSS